MADKPRIPWPTVFMIGFSGIALSPAFPAPFPALSLGTKLGTALYVGSLLVLGGAAIVAQMRREAVASEKEAERAAADVQAREEQKSAAALLREIHRVTTGQVPDANTLHVAIQNDELGSDTVGNILRTLADENLAPVTRAAAVRGLIRDYFKDRVRVK